MSVKKSIFRIFDGKNWNEVYHKTSADQVVCDKNDGSKTNVQDVIDDIRDAFVLEGSTLTIDLDKLGGV